MGKASGSATCATAPKVRIEVRQTAGRCIVDEVFTVGRAPESDVQTSGDCTVSRLQFIVASLPGGIVVADAWSSGGTRVVRRGDATRSLPTSIPSQRSAFLIPHGERVILLIGARTTVSLGPSAREAGKLAPPPLPPPPPPEPLSQPEVRHARALQAEQPRDPQLREPGQPQPRAQPCAGAAAQPSAEADPPAATTSAGAAVAVVTMAKGAPTTPGQTACGAGNAATTAVVGASTTPGRTSATHATNQASAAALNTPVSASVAGAAAVPVVGSSSAPTPAAAPTADATRAAEHPPMGPEPDAAAVLPHQLSKVAPSVVADAEGAADASSATGAVGAVRVKDGLEVASAATGVGASAQSKAALGRCLAAVQASVRLHRAAVDRERLRWRCSAARRARVVTAEQCTELEEWLDPMRDNAVDEVRDILDGLGVPPAPDEVMVPKGGAPWTCTICRESHRTRGWRCPFRHRYCRECMVRWAELRALPTCPMDGCGYRLGEHDLEDLRVSGARLEAFRAARLEEGLLALQEDAESQVVVFRCQGAGCGSAVVLGRGEERRRLVCPCGAPPACTGCGAVPYHYHATCASVQPLRARWLAWLQGGREAYQGLQRRAAREATAQQRALREALDRQAELERDETWKAENCRVCPKCHCLVEKIDGCNTMVCGQNTHGGNRQPGCGHRFSWQTAKPYKARHKAARVSPAPALARAGAVSGRGVRHLFTQCGICGSGGKCIVGPRFRCIHCPSFSSCMKCEERLASEHADGHVFQIMFEDDLDWGKTGVVLPKGTRARIRRQSDDAALERGAADDTRAGDVAAGRRRQRERDDSAGLEGIVRGQKRGKYVLELAGGAGTRNVEVEKLQPLLTPRQAERLLAAVTPPKPRAAAAQTLPRPPAEAPETISR
mmetsp:Transcript_33727/g.93153  ORF Transcript_33727/g.93153 Transcript_33727/m.93153 type:complete len:898 (-) Transcript_33727:152-2845(-)